MENGISNEENETGGPSGPNGPIGPDEPGTSGEPGASGEPGTSGEPDGIDKKSAYRAVCAKLGLVVSVYFVCRILGRLLSAWIDGFAGVLGQAAAYTLGMSVVIALNYFVPILLAAALLKSYSHYSGSGGLRALYKRPRRLARALGTFPAVYGLGYGTALATLLAIFLITRLTGGQAPFEDIVRPTVLEPSPGVAGALMTVVLMVVIAPVLEEFWVRGIMYDALRPYGSGIAIIISSVIFGLMHGSVQMLFYTTALGLALGYVRYATGSLFVGTILHAIVNSVSSGLLLLNSLTGLAFGGNKLLNTAFSVYVLAMLVLIVVGLSAFFKRIPVIRTYRFENEWREIGAGKKTALFFASIPVIIMLVLAINECSHDWMFRLLLCFGAYQ